MTEPVTHTLDVPGAVLHYDIRAHDPATEPALLLIGSPMGASGFAELAGHFTDRTVVTHDPRGAERSKRTDGALETTPDEHADDLHRLIAALGDEPVDIFASSGGAVNALALVAKHPEQVRNLVAHEPPVAQELPDRKAALAACAGIHQTYQRHGFGPAMAQFIALVVVGVGADSSQAMAGRAAVAVAERLGTAPVTFPGGHGGFMGDANGTAGDPEAFAATLREVLSD